MKRSKTYTPRPGDVERDWWLIDAADVPLGRLSTAAARLLRGKHKPQFAPHMDVGDFVVIVNAAKVGVTGRKEEQKRYYRHSGYPGGIRSESLGELRDRRPELIVERAVKGMLPKNRLGRRLNRKLKVYPGPDHPHGAQKPKAFELDVRKVGS